MQNYKTDILIVGTGASGLFAALHCPSDKYIDDNKRCCRK